jgi:N-acetylglucosaminyl-diphospho-decaprenol L-rhamnosyltransferase
VTRLTIVIVSFNARDDLARTLESLVAHPPSTSHEIVVVDNASADGAPAMVAARFAQVRLIQPGRNLGFAAANNLGIRATRSELVLLLNPDTIVAEGAIDRLVARLDRSRDIAIVGPRIVDERGRTEMSFGGPLGPLQDAVHAVLARLDARGSAFARHVIERAARRERRVGWVTGACLLVRRDLAEAAGLLDERYFLYMEDVDFCDTVRAHGGQVVFTPSAEVVHVRGRSGAGAPAATDEHWQRSHLAYYRKHLPRWAPLLERYLRRRRPVATQT